MELNKLVFLEWSFSQKCFHIEEAVRSIRSNRSALINKYSTDYVPIGLYENDLDASAAAEQIRRMFPEVFDRSEEEQVKREMSLEIDRLLTENDHLKERLKDVKSIIHPDPNPNEAVEDIIARIRRLQDGL